MTIKLLDCTLRDGGYYNNWDFEPSTVHKYLVAMASSGVDMVEIGFRLKPANTFLGAFAYSTDDYLAALNVQTTLKLAVMINASEFVAEPRGGASAVDTYFAPAALSPVSMVRIALRVRDVASAKHIALRLRELGYTLAVNLMQIDSLNKEEIISAAKEIASWGAVDVLYFADSLGNLEPESTRQIIRVLDSVWPGELGFHSHDNKGQAFVNCLAAADSGVTWLDATILGMGRGAGNVRTENLLIELEKRKLGTYNVQSLYPLVLEDFAALHKQYGWGANLFYHLSAVEGIHPTYVQELLASDRYSPDEILSALKYLSGTEARSYNPGALGAAVRGADPGGEGTWHAGGWAQGRSVLIIGSGASTAQHMGTIEQYIRRKQPIVLCLNINRAVPTDLVSAYVACHESRILIEAHHYCELGRPVILPLARVPKGVRALLKGVEVLDYGLRLSDKRVEVGNTGCVLPTTLAAAYAIAIATAAGAERILMTGIDGYAAGDPRQEEMIEALEHYQRVDKAIPIMAITPTTYPIMQRSIYEPNL
ncbi:MAG: aldolase catalytic domain-containing protein [Nitrosomonadales bacterium]|nr:aldolase catalytic domain-containing protein [Nitrosomonadales bacterium]